MSNPGTTDLLSYWSLEESSGTRVDAHGSNDLTDGNTCTSATGIQGDGCRMTRANNEYLTITDASQTGLDMGANDFSISYWIYWHSITIGKQYLPAIKWTSAGNQRGFLIQYSSNTGAQAFDMITSSNGSNVAVGSISMSGSPLTIGTWYHVVHLYDASAGSFETYVNNSSIGSATGLHTSIHDNTSPFWIGTNADANAAPDWTIDEYGIWKGKLLSTAEISYLYNSGSGRSYADLESANNPGTTNLVSYWGLGEASGTRVDSHSSNDLGDNNTVTQGTGIVGNCADFERSNSEYLSITNASQTGLDFGSTDHSISFWVNFETIANQFYTAFGKYQNSGQLEYQYRLWGYDNQEAYVQWSGNGTSVTGKTFNMTNFTNWSTGTWYHIVWVADVSAGSVEMFVNGVSEATVTGLPTSIHQGTDMFTMGVGLLGGGEYIDARMDEVAIFNDILTSDEVTWLYNSGSGRSYADISGGGAAPFVPKVIMF